MSIKKGIAITPKKIPSACIIILARSWRGVNSTINSGTVSLWFMGSISKIIITGY